MTAELYVLDWQDTAYAKQPTADEVYQWAIASGLVIEGMPKVYANGTVQMTCEPSPLELWPSFTPVPQTRELKLQSAVQAVLQARKELRVSNGTQERALLAVIDLLLVGYGVDG